jgi:hypothetical protein
MLLRRCPACRKLVPKCFYAGQLAKHAEPVPDEENVADTVVVMPAHPEWEEDDRVMEEHVLCRWMHRIGHECGHATACLACGHCPEGILLGDMRDENGKVHQGLVKGGSLPAGASAENQAIVCLAGMVGETILFGRHDDGAERDVQQVKPHVEEILAREGEKRSAAEIEKDLIEAAERLLRENKDFLDALYSEGLERAKEHGLARLHLKPIELLTGGQIQHVFDVIKKGGAKK